MFLFDKHAPDARCGLLIDVASASVVAAIVVSEIDEAQPTVVWSYTERCAITESPDTVALAKRVTTALLNVSLEVQGRGLKALAAHEPKLRIGYVQVSVGAPWSYTVPKAIRFQRDEPFIVTETLVHDLATTAEQETTAAQSTSPLFDTLGLEVISSETSHFTANGYTITDPIDQKTTALTLVRKVSICQKRLVDSIREIHDTLAPRAVLSISSFMDTMQRHVVQATMPSNSYGLIDISGDAAEVGIIQGGVLQSVVSNTWGTYAVAEALAGISQEPVNTAYARLQAFASDTELCRGEKQQDECTLVLDQYRSKLSSLIAQAAATTELPLHFMVHSDTGLRDFVRQISLAALNELAPTSQCTVVPISEKLTDIVTLEETRLAVSVAVFHTQAQT